MASGFNDNWYDIYRRKKSSNPSGNTGQITKGGGGGGGGKKSRLGKTGPRGRRFAKESFAGKRSVIIKARYDKANADSDYRIQAWLTYCSKEKDRESAAVVLTRDERTDLLADERPTDPSLLREPEFFSAFREGISRNEATDLIISNKGEKVNMWTMILSPGDRDVDPNSYARDQRLKNMIDAGIMQLGQMRDQNSVEDCMQDDKDREHEDGLQR